MNLKGKERMALDVLKGLGSVAVAFSGGTDSALVCSLAREALGDGAIAVTGRSPLFPAEELEEARRAAGAIGIRMFEVDVPVMSDEGFVANPADRCYRCKRLLLRAISDLAGGQGIRSVVDGGTEDDLADVRPGTRAGREQGVRSPLQEAGMTKEDVRALSKTRGLPGWDKPSAACLASRIPYGTPITEELLGRIGGAERFLRSNGFSRVRVRAHGRIARIEVEPGDMPRLLARREEVVRELKKAGFIYVSLDMQGFRSGSMNEVL